MRTGTIGYATDTGLGIQTKQFFDNGLIQEIFVWAHSTYHTHWDWYPNRCKSIDELLSKVDRLIFFETPFEWNVITKARKLGIKTILMGMYECTAYPFHYNPDVVIGGSEMEAKLYGCRHINVPVGQEWKLRTRAKIFIHNSGRGGLGGRNGTRELLEAMKLVKSPVKLVIRAQNGGIKTNDPRVTVINESVPYEDLYKTGDVLILTEKFGGSFLPMQEAFASGMPVMATDRFPTNTWLPKELLVKPRGYKNERIAVEFESAILDPIAIANKIDGWYDEDISKFSYMGKKWAKDNSWEKLKPIYEAL